MSAITNKPRIMTIIAFPRSANASIRNQRKARILQITTNGTKIIGNFISSSLEDCSLGATDQ